ncbi:hypothetical protein POJ06DRAFT_255126 [Lipomyces tetrasporus]|uniref:PX domain-containing protein n=1 Tax=Lipomyces tetrasporus TaxID=54092 RepID=A0AAD7QRD2_9ASCO|nr:uncharacterized protein POJ06DRAFT_255126 [Lipomyces tetrasporus]KAJ8099995.1 hypothetical protein POJ06DRAFT_255126 [Lipomyces tetrasporus]
MAPADGTPCILTGQQEHYLKKELISLQIEREMAGLSVPDALRRFGAPFRAESHSSSTSNGKNGRLGFFKGKNSSASVSASQITEVTPGNSDFPILRHVFVNHVRTFPFLDQTKETEFWQDKVQTFWESFSSKRISTTDDRTEETKRKRMAFQIQKLIEIMMSSGIRTSSGLEKGVEVDDIDLGTTTTGINGDMKTSTAAGVDTTDKDKFMISNAVDGHPINGFDINVVGVRVVYEKKRVRSQSHLEFLIRTRQEKHRGDVYVSRRYSDFRNLHQELLHAFPEKNLPRVPMKNRNFTMVVDDNVSHSSPTSAAPSAVIIDNDHSADVSPRSSIYHIASDISGSSSSTSDSASPVPSPGSPVSASRTLTHKFSRRSLTKRKSASLSSASTTTLHANVDNLHVKGAPGEVNGSGAVKLPGELQRLSLRAFLRSLVAIPSVAESEIFRKFLTDRSFHLSDLTLAEITDIRLRKDADAVRLEEQFKFFQIATQRARELDKYMAEFKKDLIQRDGLSKFFLEIREKGKLADLAPQYQKFVEWARIEIAATIYHFFLGSDNASEMLAQTKRIHRLMPYTLVKNVIRFSNPVSMMKAMLDLFLAQPFGQKSLLQRILHIALYEDVKVQERAIQLVRKKIENDNLCDRVQKYVDAEQDVRDQINWEADEEDIDIIVAIAKTDEFGLPVDPEVVGDVINSWIAWNIAVEDVTVDIDDQIRFFSNLKSLLKLMIRKRDKDMVLSLSGERVTIELLKDLFTMFYQPLVRVYKSASVHNSVSDVAAFVEDLIKTVDECEEDGANLDANVLVQKFVDLCERHQESFYRFVHEVHVHDDGLFTQLMLWIEEILRFLRDGPKSTIDMNELFIAATTLDVIYSETGDKISVDRDRLMKEIDSMIEWNRQRKTWREKRLRDKLREAQRRANGENVDDEEIDEADIDEAEWKQTLPQLLRGGDFGLHDEDLEDFAVDQSNLSSDEGEEDDEDWLDPIEYERRARARRNRRGGRNGEPAKPNTVEIPKLVGPFVERLRVVLA